MQSKSSSWKVKVKQLSRVRLFATPWTVAHQTLCLWGFSSKNIGVGCHAFLQGIFPIQGLNPGLPRCRQTLYPLSHQGSLDLLPNAMSIILANQETHAFRNVYFNQKIKHLVALSGNVLWVPQLMLRFSFFWCILMYIGVYWLISPYVWVQL